MELPFSYYQTFHLEQRFGFNRTTPHLWLIDGVKSAVIGLLIGAPLIFCALWLMHRAGAWWWLMFFAVWAAFNLLLMIIFPLWIAPLFNRFTPLEDENLIKRVRALMQRCRFRAGGLFVMDGSRRSAHANAYFTGFGAARRVVFFDTLLKQLQPEEIEAVLAHEIGHFRRGHLLRRLTIMFLTAFFALALLGFSAQRSWFYTGLGVTPNLPAAFGGTVPSDALALLLFSLVAPTVSFFLTPIAARLSRKHEFEADRFAAEHADPAALSSALIKLTCDNAATLTPDPLYARFYYSHPPTIQRLARLTPPVKP